MSSVKTSTSLEVSGMSYAPCPFCDGEFGTGHSKEAGGEVVVHTLPACLKYLALTADDFLDAVLQYGRKS